METNTDSRGKSFISKKKVLNQLYGFVSFEKLSLSLTRPAFSLKIYISIGFEPPNYKSLLIIFFLSFIQPIFFFIVCNLIRHAHMLMYNARHL